MFHAIGFIGIIFFDKDFFIRATPVNLLLMFLLLLYTQQKPNKWLWFFMAVCFLAGISAEIIGTKTGWLFGDYHYGTVLGPVFNNVPLLIGINWFIIVYCCGITVHTLLNRILERMSVDGITPKTSLKAMSIIVDGATLATLFDWIIEPVAVKLGYWQWGGSGPVPFYNYICWFLISAILLAAFHHSRFNKQNKFAVNLLLIQVMFFLLLRTFL